MTAFATVAAIGVGLLAFTWWPNGDYRPIQPGEKGTIQGAVASLAEIPSGRPALTERRERELGGAPSERDVLRGEAQRNPVAAGDQDAETVPQRDGEQRATPTPSATPESTATPEPTETPAAAATPEPTVTPEPTATPEATVTPEPTATPEATVTPAGG